MSEASRTFYRIHLVLTALGALFLLLLCGQFLLAKGMTPTAVGFGCVFLLLLLLAGWAVVRRLARLKREAGAAEQDVARKKK